MKKTQMPEELKRFGDPGDEEEQIKESKEFAGTEQQF